MTAKGHSSGRSAATGHHNNHNNNTSKENKRQRLAEETMSSNDTKNETRGYQQEESSPKLNGNQTKAQRYIDVALGEINVGNYEQAMVLLERAKQLWPESQAEEILNAMQKLRANMPNASANQTADRFPPKATTYQRKRPMAPTESYADINEYTPQQLELVRKVNSCKNFYQVLSVTRAASDTDIKKAYKRLALQLHPDKNRAPGSVDAFKTVGNAVEVLSDEEKRKVYDAGGGNTLYASGCATSNQQRYYHNAHSSFEATFGRADDISAEELFNMFFGNFPTQGRQRRAYQSANQRQPRENYQQPSLAFGLILVLIIISMLSSLFTADPLYNLVQSRKYPIRRETQHLSVPYYVKEHFEKDYRGSLGRLESSVEEDFIYTMKQNCYRERSYREAMMARARSFGSRAQFAQAQGLKTPSCDNLAKIGIMRYSMY